jgi:Tfp pilus assembly protein PilF
MRYSYPYFNNGELDSNSLSGKKDRLISRAWGYSQLNMHKEAVAECEKLVKIDLDDASSYIYLGFYYEKNGEKEKAIECYKYMMKTFPYNSESYINLGYIFEKQEKRNDMARVCYEKALELNPDDEWAINNIGALLQKEGKWKEALPYYKNAYEASKLTGEANNLILHNLAWAYYNCKEYNEAMLLYRQLVNEESDNAEIHSDLGCVLCKMGRFNDALASFESALKLSSGIRRYKRLYRFADSHQK